MPQDIYTEIIREFNHNRINYIVIGVSGINYYAGDVHNLIMTADFDIFLKPEVKNVFKALKILKSKGLSVSTKYEAVQRLSKKKIENIVRMGKSLSCSNPYGNIVDLCLQVSGFTFDELVKDANVFKAGRTPIRVGQLGKLLRMKEIA